MTPDPNEIETNIKVGQRIFENLPKDIRPGWAGLILSVFDPYVKEIPVPILELYLIVNNKERWKEAHQQFTKIRVLGLENKNYRPESYLILAELVAKVTYNASEQPAPFDGNCGHYIASLALKLAEHFKDARLEQEVMFIILLYHRNKKLKYILTTANDFLLYKKIDHIFWFDWNPKGINESAPRDEYRRYIPDILTLIKEKASMQEIANRLYKLETNNMGVSGTPENCLAIACEILKQSKFN
ncbi:hypothetical protein ACN9ML_17470 [Dyadobacter endophyticus]|uniref:hypothetical protein n=1 Tax=Dyadobacter endophyticus TaxID=1749036 RepID=UPI003CEC0058